VLSDTALNKVCNDTSISVAISDFFFHYPLKSEAALLNLSAVMYAAHKNLLIRIAYRIRLLQQNQFLWCRLVLKEGVDANTRTKKPCDTAPL
jgi:hypothetical protein